MGELINLTGEFVAELNEKLDLIGDWNINEEEDEEAVDAVDPIEHETDVSTELIATWPVEDLEGDAIDAK